MGKQEDKKASRQNRNDNGKIPLVIINDRAEDGEEKADVKPVNRKRSRAISTVSMHSNSSVDVQQSGAVR